MRNLIYERDAVYHLAINEGRQMDVYYLKTRFIRDVVTPYIKYVTRSDNISVHYAIDVETLDEYVEIVLTDSTYYVCITADSLSSIMTDVMKKF